MEIPAKNSKVQSGARARNILFTLLLFIVVLAFASFAYLKSINVNIESIKMSELLSGAAFKSSVREDVVRRLELSYDYKENAVFGIYGDYLVKCSSAGIAAYNKKGEQVWSRDIALSNPILRTNGDQMLAANVGGREICLIGRDAVIWSLKTDGDILSASLSESGHAAIVIQSQGHRGKVMVLDPLGIEMFTRNIAERFVYDAKISPRGKQVLINSVDTSAGFASTSIEFTDMQGNPFAARIPREDELFPLVRYMDEEGLLAVGNNYVVYYDKNREEKWSREIPGIYSSCIAGNKYGIIASEGEKGLSRVSEVQVVDSRGKTVSKFQVRDAIVSLNATGSVIAVNTGREALFYTLNGKLLGSQAMKSDILAVDFFNNREAAIISKSSVDIISLN